MKTLPPWEAASHQPFPCGHQSFLASHARTASQASNGAHGNQGLPAVNLSLYSREQSCSLKLRVSGSLLGLLQCRNSPGRCCEPRGMLTWGTWMPPATGCSGQHKTRPQPPFLSPHSGCNRSRSSLTLLFIFVSFLGTGFQTFENSPLSTSFPSCLSSQCLIMFHFQTRSPFPFQPLFYYPGPGLPDIRLGLCNCLALSQAKYHSICGTTHQRERERSS